MKDPFPEALIGRTALTFLQVPEEYRNADGMTTILRQTVGGDIVIKIKDVRLKSNRDEMEMGVRFFSTSDVDLVLSRMSKLLDSGPIPGTDLIYGRWIFNFNGRQIVVEGVVKDDDKQYGNPPTETNLEMHRSAQHAEEQANAQAMADWMDEMNAEEAKSFPETGGETGSTNNLVSLIISFFLLYSSPIGHDTASKNSFLVHPYLVAQMLRGHVLARSIVMLPTKRNVRKNCDNYRALIEVNPEDSSTVKNVFDGIIIELSTTRTRDTREEQISEGRFRIFVHEAPHFKGVMERRRVAPGEFGDVYDPTTDMKDGFVFNRMWLEDPLAAAVIDRTVKERKGASRINATTATENSRATEEAAKRRRIEERAANVPQQHAETTASSSPNVSSALAVAQANAGLPPGWMAVFSQEYQRVYYAYRCPVTGAEKTSWARPEQ